MVEEATLVRSVEHARRALISVTDAFELQVLEEDVGRVVRAADGVATIIGLPNASVDEVLHVGSSGHRALVLGLDPHATLAVSLGLGRELAVGAPVRLSGRVASLGVGEGLLGRVVDALGRPVDGHPLTGSLSSVPLERPAPPIHHRAAVHAPLYTGTLAVDAMLPMGRGQRELIVGDEGTGKTTLARDALLRQAKTDIVSVYCAIGRRRTETWGIVQSLKAAGGRWVVVSAPEDEGPGLRTLAPYAATAIAEFFAYRGEHALVVYDDLSSHADAWRELSLLLRRPPGREAYPGDVFYLHARLLERSAQLSPELGGGSLTALPIATIEGSRLSGYIPTNLVSITDGQIVLSSELFASGQKPAIDVGTSVSRVGAKAQSPTLRRLAGRLRLDYASFLELEAFSRLGTRLEAHTARKLEIGARLRVLLQGEPHRPLDMFGEIARLVIAQDHELLLRLGREGGASEIEQVVTQLRAAESDLEEDLTEGAPLTEEAQARMTAFLRSHVGLGGVGATHA